MTANPQRFHPIDALRGIAALMVLFFHLLRNSASTEVLAQAMPSFLVTVFDYARSGVAVFFVISGFVIAYSTRRLEPTVRAGANFALRRQIRLDPPYYMVLAGVLLVGLIESQVASLEARTFTLPEVLINMVYLQDITGTPAILAVAWTLCIEVQFYLTLVLLLLVTGKLSAGRSQAVSKRWLRAACLTLGAVSLSLPFLHVAAGPWFIGTWWMFALGMTVSWYLVGDVSARFAWICVAIVGLWCALVPVTGVADPWKSEIFAWLTAVLIMALVVSRRIDKPVPRFLLWFGAVSYSLYLVHLPVIDVTMGGLYKITGDSVLGAYAAFAVALACSILVAYLLHRFVEKRSIAWANRFKPKRSTEGEGFSGFQSPAVPEEDLSSGR